MRNTILILAFAVALTSCILGGRIVEINDSTKGIESLKLIQNVSGISIEKPGRPYYSISTVYLLEIKKSEKPSLLLDIQMQSAGKTIKPDSLMLMDLDGEKIEIAAYKSGTIQLKSHQFIVPENLWISIANTEKIQYRLYIEKEGINVKLNPAQTAKLKEFLNKSMHLRNANLPPIPEGLKKL